MRHASATRRGVAVFLVLSSWVCGLARADSPEVVLDYRLKPGRDLSEDTQSVAITTVRVLEDRGLVAKSNGRLSARPLTIHLSSQQSARFITGTVQADQSFPVELRMLSKATYVKGPNGQDQRLPDKTPLDGLRVLATLERDGRLREGSVSLQGLTPELAEPMRAAMAAVLAQAAAVPPISLTVAQGVPQEVALKVPVPGLVSLDVKMHIVNQLLGVEAGVARIQQVYSMDFGTPPAAIKMTAEGTGGGTLLYEVSSQTLLSSETSTRMKMTIEGPEGVMGIQLDVRQSQEMRPTPAEAPRVGGDRDAQGCLPAAGYTWCASERACVRPWELAKAKGFELGRDGLLKHCAVVP